MITKFEWNRMWDAVLVNGGYSHFFSGREPERYIVADGRKGIKLSLPTPECLDMYVLVSQLAESYKIQGFEGIGFWVNNDVLYIDPIDSAKFVGEALLVAKHRSEKAIWDSQDMVEITV